MKRIVLTYDNEHDREIIKNMLQSLKMKTGKNYNELVLEGVKILNNKQHVQGEQGN